MLYYDPHRTQGWVVTQRWVPTTGVLVAALVAVIASTGDAIAGEGGDSVTVTFPNADKFGPIEISAELLVPDGDGPFPAIVQLHGSGGPGEQDYKWAAEFRDMGYVALVIDSFGSRGLESPALTDSHNQINDAYGALAYLQGLSFVDADHMGIAGRSRGAMSALRMAEISGVVSSQRLKRRVGERVRAIVAFYPLCMMTDGYVIPVLILIGERDDWTPASTCVLAVQFVMERQPTASIDIVVYPGATHGFDAEFAADAAQIATWAKNDPEVEAMPGGYRYKGHFIAYDAKAHADSIARVEAFLAEHLGRASAEGAAAGD